jgi:hydroxymethylpyrimidine pyrophosphatase-like HAD family hydrolase|tara:strand:+ start:791 stop:1090 length:300 start_codon:yes stop_codon:yes gene_type:complete
MVYCFDLDGTLCNTDGNNYKDSTPKKERIKIVNTLYEDGHTILIDTARGCVSGKNYFFFTMEQLKSWGVKFHTLRTGVKFGADIFVDDKGVKDQLFFKD